MDPVTLAAFVKFAAAVAPELIVAIEHLVESFKSQHPSLGAPPPADGEAAVDAAVDQEVAKLFEK